MFGADPGKCRAQVLAVERLGGIAVHTNGRLAAQVLETLDGIAGVIYWGADAQDYARALARRDGPIVPLVTTVPDAGHVMHERHLCVDTTAAGGNVALIAGT